jgi:hypothetical protein
MRFPLVVRVPRDWPPRDSRQLLALLFLGGGGVALTVFAWRLATLTANKSQSPWPVAYALYGTLVLLGIVLTGFSYVLGKSRLSIKAGKDGFEADSVGGDAAEALPAAAATETPNVTS